MFIYYPLLYHSLMFCNFNYLCLCSFYSGIDAEKVISPMNMAQLRIDRIQLVSFCEQMSISRECLAVINR